MASYQDDSSIEFSQCHKREQSQDSGAYIDWNSEDSTSPISNPDNIVNEDFITVVSVENGESEATKNAASSFVTILAIGESKNEEDKNSKNFEDKKENEMKEVLVVAAAADEEKEEEEEEVLLYRLPGERLGFGLKFEGGTNTAETVKRLFIQSSAPDSPASRAKCSWGSLVEGDEILKVDGHLVKEMTRLDCVRFLKESSVVIKLHVRHKRRKTNQLPNINKQENATEIRVNNSTSSSPMVVSAEMKKTIPPPPPVPPRKMARKSPDAVFKEEPTVVSPPEGFCDQNFNSPVPKARNIQVVVDETAKNLSKFVIRVPQKCGHDSPDVTKRAVKRTGSDLKLIPPEPKVYLDLLAQEDSRNCESESDDTGSTISTVVGLSIPNTSNSSFSDLRSSASSFCDSTNPSTPTSEPSTPVLDLSKMLSSYEYGDNNEYLFTKLINGKDQDSISFEEKISSCTDDIAPLQPPLSFQDAPLSYGNEEMRANLSENLEFQDMFLSSKNHHNVISESESLLESKIKENNSKPSILSKKPSLIPRLAKSIGLLSPPKPSPRKESTTDSNKSRFNKKKPPPLPSLEDTLQGAQTESVESKTLKSSIPYLKKKKNKNEDLKKISKTDKKSKPSNDIDDNRKKPISLSHECVNSSPETEVIQNGPESDVPKTPENTIKLTWKVPDLKISKGNHNMEFMNKIKNDFEEVGDSEAFVSRPVDFILDLENSDFKTEVKENSETHFLFLWGGSKQLETIGEDEEDINGEEVLERHANCDRVKEEKSFIKISEEISNMKIVEKSTLENDKSFGKTINTACEEIQEKELLKDPEEVCLTEIRQADKTVQTTKEAEESTDLEDKTNDSEGNGLKHENTLCNNHVLVKLDNDSLEVVKNIGLNSSNGETKEVMVPIVPTTTALAPTSSFSRMPPDGHEFPQNFAEQSLPDESITGKIQHDLQLEPVEAVLPPLPTSEPPSTSLAKCSLLFDRKTDLLPDMRSFANRTNRDSAAVKPTRNSLWRQDEKSEKSVRDKIAMFSSVSDSNDSSGKLSKYKSSDDVFYSDESDCSRNFRNGKFFSQSILTLDKISNSGNPIMKKTSLGISPAPSPRSLDYTNRTQSSMDLSPSSSAYSSSCSPDSSLSSNSSYLGFSSTLPRKKTREDDKNDLGKKETGILRTSSFSIHGRSQSLLDVNPAFYKTRYFSEGSHDDVSKTGSLNMLIEQRRKNLSKLRGLVIPEKLSETVSSQPIVDLPEIKSKDLILNSKVPSANKEKTKNFKWGQISISETSATPKLNPTHLWDQSKSPNIPKYSPAFKRKSISVFNAKEPLYSRKEIQSKFQEPIKAPMKPPRKITQTNFADRKYQDNLNSSDGETYLSEKSSRLVESPRPFDMYVPKRKSTPQGKYRLHGDSGRSEEDSDNDSAVSSSRSSISHGFSPPASPLLDNQFQTVDDSGHRSSLSLSSSDRSPLIRTLSSDTTLSVVSNTSTLTSGSQASISSNDVSSSDANNKRILKPQSVEAINRKNVLASAKYSRGFDVKSGSPLIQRKFSEETFDKKESNVQEVYSARDDHYRGKNYFAKSNSSTTKSETETLNIGKVAYITDVEDLTVSAKKKLEKSESLPVEPTVLQTPVLRKTSIPFGYSWENGNNRDQSPEKQAEVSKDNCSSISFKNSLVTPTKVSLVNKSTNKPLASNKDLEFSTRNKNNNSSIETDLSLSSMNLSNESLIDKIKNITVECKGTRTLNEKATNSGRRSTSVNDIRKTFEKVEAGAPSSGRIGNSRAGNSTAGFCGVNGNHVRVSSLDSTNSEENCALVQGPHSFSSNLQREQFGSITSLASSTSLISPQELQLLIEEANQTLEESVTNAGGSSPNSHDVLVIILHRDSVGGSVGITLAGGADYESKEITVHKVLAGSPADRDGRIQKGDRILSINGKSMKGVTHRESLAILKSPRLEVVLVVSRLKTDPNSESIIVDDVTLATACHSFLSGSSKPPKISETLTIIESDLSKKSEILRGPPVTLSLLKDGAGLGFSLEGGKDCPTGDRPLVIKKIFTGGAAEKCGQLKSGDELMSVNGIDVSVMSRIEVWKLMKQLPDGNVTITVKHQVESKPVA